MASAGGSGGDGVIFELGTGGTGYAVTHAFLGGPNDGRNPNGSLIASGGGLVGMTLAGGAGEGTMFQADGRDRVQPGT